MKSKEKVEKIISGIYTKYAPLKADEVANLMRKYEGQETELLKRICKKYGVLLSDLEVFELDELPPESGISKKSRGRIVRICAFCLLGILLVFFVRKFSYQDRKDLDQEVVDTPKELPVSITENLHVSIDPVVENAEKTSVMNIENSFEVKQKTFFHDLPTEESKRKAYLIVGERFESLKEENGFLFVEFVNPKGQKTIGWIRNDTSIRQIGSKLDSGTGD